MSDRLGVSVLTGLLIVIAFLGWRILVLLGPEAGFEPPGSTTTTTVPDAGSAFVDAWRRGLEGEYLMEGVRVREGGGETARSAEIVANVRGRRLVNIDGTIVYRNAEMSRTCRQTISELFCTPERPVADDELSAISKSDGRYRVAPGHVAGCYDVVLDPSVGSPDPRFGTEASFCFDAATGAVVSSRVVGLNRSDTWEADSLESEVTADRLAGRFPQPLIAELLG